MTFDELYASLTQRGLDWHRETIIANSIRNAPHITKTIRDIQPVGGKCLIVSGGPSLYREKILSRIAGWNGTIVATDSAYIQCLRHDIKPAYVVTLDPHPTRMVRWFGDPDIERNLANDDYFERQDLDIAFRRNQVETNRENIGLIDAHPVPLVISTTSPENVVGRTSAFDRYWFAPLVDDPSGDTSITRTICERTGVPAINTGGTVGTACWVFALSVLGANDIAVVGMDHGYYSDTPLEQTQSYRMLNGDPQYYPQMEGFWGKCYTDPTYLYYRDNMLDLLHANDAFVTNCSGHGILQGENVTCWEIEDWLASS